MRRLPLLVLPVLLLGLVHAQEAEETPPDVPGQVFEVENFSVKAPSGSLVMYTDAADRPLEREAAGYALNPANRINALILRHPEKRDGDQSTTVEKSPELPKAGIQWAEFGRLPEERVVRNADDRRAFVTDWLAVKRDPATNVVAAAASSSGVDRDKLSEQIWEHEAAPPRTFLQGTSTKPGYWDLKPGESATWDEKTQKWKGWVERDDIECVRLVALYFHEKGIYHGQAWGYVLKGEGRDKLQADMLALLKSFEVKKATTFEQDLGASVHVMSAWKARRSGTSLSLSMADGGQRNYQQSGPPYTQVGYRVSCRIDPAGGPYIEGADLDAVIESFRAGYAKTKREKDTMNFITSSSVDKKAKTIKLGDKKAGTEYEVQQLTASYSWTTLHQTGKAGKFDTVKENMVVTLTVLDTRRGPLLVLTSARKQDDKAADKMHESVLESLKLTDENKPE
jgi:hypothetical protein